MTDEERTQVLDRPETERRVRTDARPRKQPRYHVVLWDDDEHSYSYVIRMMRDLFGRSLEQGYAIAKEVDTRGKAIVLTTTREHAELKRDQIKAYGADSAIASSSGSMRASIQAEPT